MKDPHTSFRRGTCPSYHRVRVRCRETSRAIHVDDGEREETKTIHRNFFRATREYVHATAKTFARGRATEPNETFCGPIEYARACVSPRPLTPRTLHRHEPFSYPPKNLDDAYRRSRVSAHGLRNLMRSGEVRRRCRFRDTRS